MAPTFTPDRQTYRKLVAVVARAAKAKLPLAVNGRIESAARLVLWQDVEPQADGSILVGSASDPGKQYRLVGTACECQDFQYGKAPDGWCAHRIAAGIHKRVGQMLAAPPEPEVVLPEGMEPFPVNDDEPLPEAPPLPAPALAEAPASVNVRLQIHRHEVQITLRDHDETRLLGRLEALLQRYPLPQPVQPARPPQEPEPEKRYCPKHGTEMQQNFKEGRSWWSHRTPDGQWCKGK